jgi:hypothetical protein
MLGFLLEKVKRKLFRYRIAGTKGERRYNSHSFFTSAMDGSEWFASPPGRAIPREELPRVWLVGIGRDW